MFFSVTQSVQRHSSEEETKHGMEGQREICSRRETVNEMHRHPVMDQLCLFHLPCLPLWGRRESLRQVKQYAKVQELANRMGVLRTLPAPPFPTHSLSPSRLPSPVNSQSLICHQPSLVSIASLVTASSPGRRLGLGLQASVTARSALMQFCWRETWREWC